MTTAWLLLTLCMAAVATSAAWSRRDTHHRTMAVLALVIAAPLSFYTLRVPLGLPDDSTPVGKWNVHGARIDVDEAIYVLVSHDGLMPVYLKLPYTTQTANELQAAMDAAQGDEGPTMEMQDGEAKFEAPPVAPDPPKES
jgi:hypothetical protein